MAIASLTFGKYLRPSTVEAMNKINELITAINSLSDTSNDVATLKTQMSTANTNIGTLQTQMTKVNTSLYTDLSTAETTDNS
jgi:hypothetical protein